MAYQKQNFEDKAVLFASELNHMEDGIANATDSVEALEEHVQDVKRAAHVIELTNFLYGHKGKTVATESASAYHGIITSVGAIQVPVTPDKKYVLVVDIINNTETRAALSIMSQFRKKGTNTSVGKRSNSSALSYVEVGVSNYYATEYTFTEAYNVWLYLHTQGTSGKAFDITVSRIFLIEVDLDDTFDYIEYLKALECTPTVLFGDTIEHTEMRVDALESVINPEIAKVYCWGDSQTGGGHDSTCNSYPYYLQELIGDSMTVTNYGNGGENINAIAFRVGSMPLYIEPFTLPIDTSQVAVTTVLASGKSKSNLFAGWNAANPVTVGGISCYLRNTGTIARVSAGSSEVVFDRPVLAVPPKAVKTLTGVHIFQVGANGGFSGIDEYIDIVRSMVNTISSVEKKYIIICPWHDGFASNFDSMTYADIIDRLYDAFGEHVLDIRAYLIGYGLADNELTATETDESNIASGIVPASLRYDAIHMNQYGYSSQAKKVYQFGKDLGYWE